MRGIRARSFLPRTAVLETTYRCNHRCIYCSCPWERDGGSFEKLAEMDTAMWKRVIGSLCEAGVTSLAFTGGESLLRDDLFELIEFAAGCTAEHVETVDGRLATRSAPPDLYLLSNGRLVSDDVLDRCAGLGIRLSLSLPGLATYAAHTGSEGADMVLSGFAAASKRGIPVTANITVTRLNLHELERTMAAAILAGADQVLLNRFLPGGRGLSRAGELMLSAQQVREMLTIADRVLRTAGRPGTLGTETPFCVADPADYPGVRIGTHCSAAIQFFTVGPSGYVRVCNHSEVRLSHVLDWPSLKNDPYWKTFAFRRHSPPVCTGCSKSHLCDAGCREAAHIVSGMLDSPDPVMPPERPATFDRFAGSHARTGAGP